MSGVALEVVPSLGESRRPLGGLAELEVHRSYRGHSRRAPTSSNGEKRLRAAEAAKAPLGTEMVLTARPGRADSAIWVTPLAQMEPRCRTTADSVVYAPRRRGRRRPSRHAPVLTATLYLHTDGALGGKAMSSGRENIHLDGPLRLLAATAYLAAQDAGVVPLPPKAPPVAS
jgi:hypothetical protein